MYCNLISSYIFDEIRSIWLDDYQIQCNILVRYIWMESGGCVLKPNISHKNLKLNIMIQKSWNISCHERVLPFIWTTFSLNMYFFPLLCTFLPERYFSFQTRNLHNEELHKNLTKSWKYKFREHEIESTNKREITWW